MLGMAIAMYQPGVAAEPPVKAIAAHKVTCIIISVDDDVLSIATPDATILQVNIYDTDNNTVLQMDGCFSSQCNIGISSLAYGKYTVQAITNHGTCSHSFTK